MEPGEFWFKSSLFHIEPGEDAETNPGVYGRQLARWLAGKLADLKYEVEIIPEDWGWVIMCARQPFMLWVGCANMPDDDDSETPAKPSEPEDIIWRCFAMAEVPFWKRLLGRIDVKPGLDRLNAELSEIIQGETGIRVLDDHEP